MSQHTSHRPPIRRHIVGKYASTPAGPPVVFRSVSATQILDSRGYPTVLVGLELDDGTVVEASAPSGASRGAYEATEFRDARQSYSGRSVHSTTRIVSEDIQPLLLSRNWTTIDQLDGALRELDGTPNLVWLGANAVVATSIAASRAFAHQADVPLHLWIARATDSIELLPVPHFNVLNGGAHASNSLDFQEFMVAPVGAETEQHAVQIGAEIFHALAARVRSAYNMSSLGDEGGFAVPIGAPEAALDLLVAAISDAGYTVGLDQVAIAIDAAANSFHEGGGRYKVDGSLLTREELADYYERLVDNYPVRSIEDGFAEDDHEGWRLLFDQLGGRVQITGDDLYVTDASRIQQGAEQRYSNAALIKPNQIGTVSQAFDAIAMAKQYGMACMVAHRAGDTVDTFIADLAVGTGVGQIKSGAPARGERVAKYNRLMEIEAQGSRLRYGFR